MCVVVKIYQFIVTFSWKLNTASANFCTYGSNLQDSQTRTIPCRNIQLLKVNPLQIMTLSHQVFFPTVRTCSTMKIATSVSSCIRKQMTNCFLVMSHKNFFTQLYYNRRLDCNQNSFIHKHIIRPNIFIYRKHSCISRTRV